MPTDTLIPEPRDYPDAESWLRANVQAMGPGFHPDTGSDEYSPALLPDDQDRLTRGLARAFDELGDRVYDIGIEAQRMFLPGIGAEE